MKTKLHRLYQKKFAAQNVVDELDHSENNEQLSRPSTYPAGEDDQNPNTFPEMDYGHTKGAEEEKKLSAILALKPTRYAAKAIAEALPDLEIDPSYLHITLVYLGKGLSEENVEKIKEVVAHVCDAHEPLKCKLQGLGLFDHVDEDEGGQPFYASVDGKGMAALRTDLEQSLMSAGIDCPSEYDFTPHMTLGYLHPSRVSFNGGSPGTSWTSKEVVLMVDDDHTKFPLGGVDERDDEEIEKVGFGVNLTELTTPSISQGGTDNPADNHQSENDFEDPDLKLGEVEAPYSSGAGPNGTRFDDPDLNVLKTPKEAVDLIDSGSLDENRYTDGDNTRQDRSISRSPRLKAPIYGK